MSTSRIARQIGLKKKPTETTQKVVEKKTDASTIDKLDQIEKLLEDSLIPVVSIVKAQQSSIAHLSSELKAIKRGMNTMQQKLEAHEKTDKKILEMLTAVQEKVCVEEEVEEVKPDEKKGWFK